MISSISFRQFKSYRDARLPLAPLTLLIGANASGKSNAIEGLRFLSWLAEGRRLDDLMKAVQAGDQGVRGTIRDLVYQAADDGQGPGDTFGFDYEMFETGAKVPLQLRIRLQMTAEGMRVISEVIKAFVESVPLYEIVGPTGEFDHQVSVYYDHFGDGERPQLLCNDQQAIFTQLDTPARFGSGRAQELIPGAILELRRFLEQILFLDPSPRAMRQYSFIVEKTLKDDGSNLSSVLYDLCTVKDQKDRVLDFIRSLPEQDIRDIDFIETPRREVMLTLSESFGDRAQIRDAGILSDGTLRVLAVAAALLSAPEGSLVVIEEIDNGVHPSRVGALLENIQSVAQERGIGVLVTTHNPALLDALPTAAIPDVVCCYRDPEVGDSRLIRLEDLEHYPELIAQGPLGRLMTQGVLDRYLKDRTEPEQKLADAMAWLETLKGGAAT
ncbi:MAG: AAA family ATPase [Candidatus Thiosymbion ectosymbiont of Robbea hypermnestra]|nr:AAA family ATPase [Candidatus Thiosymbion ectosymbiont of Robbea hypermnestra]